MPRLADHEQRRQEAIEALWRVIATQGIDKASVRHVAAETGWSRGIIDYYFDGMQALMVAGLRSACALDLEMEPGDEGDGPTALRAGLLARMPIDEERRLRGKVWLSYLGRAMTDPDIAREYADCQHARARMWGSLLEKMVAAGDIADDRDLQREATNIMAFELSMNAYALLNPGQVTSGMLEQRVDEFVNSLTGPAH